VFGHRSAGVDGAVLAEESWMLRFFDEDGADRLLIVNLGSDLVLDPAPEPLLAPIEGRVWRLLWSSEAPRYGGAGIVPLDPQGIWRFPGQAAIVLIPQDAGANE
jgi:maltooligosyltrehalose trehalohydrolase